MTVQGAAQDSKDNLIEALESGHLNDALVAQGRQILARMESVPRLAVLGLPGSGKSTLMNLLLGQNVFNEDVRLPSLALGYADAPVAQCTMLDGTITTLEGDDIAAIAALKPAYVELKMPLPALRKLSLLEVVAGDNSEEQQRAIRWASKRSDIAIWCTQYSYPVEEALWGVMPDRLLDHAYLAVTKTDEMARNGNLKDHIERAEETGGDFFYQVLPLATQEAIDARKPDGSVDKDAMRASGAMTLISAILREVEKFQHAAADAADVFLRQVDYDPNAKADRVPDPVVETPATEPTPEPAAEATTPESAPVETPQPEEAETPAPEPEPEQEPEDAPAPQEVAQAEPEPETQADPALSDAARAACAQVVEQLTAEGQALVQQLDSGAITQNAVLEVSVDTVTWLADYLADTSPANDPAMRRTCALANDAADLVQLIQLEKGDTVALDALSLMIQLKQEIQAELAA